MCSSIDYTVEYNKARIEFSQLPYLEANLYWQLLEDVEVEFLGCQRAQRENAESLRHGVSRFSVAIDGNLPASIRVQADRGQIVLTTKLPSGTGSIVPASPGALIVENRILIADGRVRVRMTWSWIL